MPYVSYESNYRIKYACLMERRSVLAIRLYDVRVVHLRLYIITVPMSTYVNWCRHIFSYAYASVFEYVYYLAGHRYIRVRIKTSNFIVMS